MLTNFLRVILVKHADEVRLLFLLFERCSLLCFKVFLHLRKDAVFFELPQPFLLVELFRSPDGVGHLARIDLLPLQLLHLYLGGESDLLALPRQTRGAYRALVELIAVEAALGWTGRERCRRMQGRPLESTWRWWRNGAASRTDDSITADDFGSGSEGNAVGFALAICSSFDLVSEAAATSTATSEDGSKRALRR